MIFLVPFTDDHDIKQLLMIKKIFALYLLLSAVTIKAGIGDWTLYPSYHNASHCEIVGNKIYVLASGALYSYDTEDTELRTYDKINTLSDVEISFIAYSSKADALVIVYRNTNIDLLYSDESVYNIPDFKNKNIANKAINGISITEGTALLSTSFGIVEIDLENKEFTNTYTLGKEVYCAQTFNNCIYASTPDGVVRGSKSDNLLDKNNWQAVNSDIATVMDVHAGRLYYIVKGKGLFFIGNNGNYSTHLLKNGELFYLHSNGEELLSGSHKILFTIDTAHAVKSYTLDGKENNYIYKKGNTIWCCKGYHGLTPCEINNNGILPVQEGITPDSPIRNYCESMVFSNGKLLVAGGNINYFDVVFYDGTAMYYNCSSGEWYNFPEEIIRTTTEVGARYRNVCTIDEDPTQEGHIVAGSFGSGLFEFKDGEFVAHHSHYNTPLESVSEPYPAFYTRVSKVKYDAEGNLWCINTGTKDIIKILKKDGSWTSLYYNKIEYMPTMVDPIIDSRGWLWITSMQGEPGLFCAKLNGTPFDTSDDESKVWLHKFTNQDGTSYDIYQVYALAEDHNGRMWVGTNTGLFVIDNPQTFFNDGVFKQIKVPRNDGTGLADYLLSGTYIKTISVDGANRKWIGTNDNGLYLISADGLETIHHFTVENSPLPSNTIESIAINDENGEVFIGTSKGMASYMSDATRPEEKLQEKNIHAYPNPVRADYSGNISITGLTYDCNVKIVDAAGILINEGTSNGGQYSWNGRNSRGEKVASGVYYVLTYDSNGDESVATKILITR